MLSQAMLTASCYYGVGNHVSVVAPLGTVAVAMKWSIISSAVVLFGIGTSKVAIIAFLLTLQGYTHLRLKYFLYFLAVTNLAFNTALPLVIIFQCNPPAGEWDSEVMKRAKCRPSSINETFGEFASGWNALTDLLLAGYPTFLLWNVQMKRKIKIGVSCLMGGGVFAAGCAAAKGWAIHFISDGADDITYNTSPLWLIGMTELWVCLIIASLPPLWPMAKHYIFGGRTSGGVSYGQNGGWHKSRTDRAEKGIRLRTIGTRQSTHPGADRSDSLERILDLQDQSHGIKVSRRVTVRTESRQEHERPDEGAFSPQKQTEPNKKDNEVFALDNDNWSSNAAGEQSGGSDAAGRKEDKA